MPAVTLLTVASGKQRRQADRYLSEITPMFPADTDVRRRVSRGDPATAILEEAGRGYDLIAMGAPEYSRDDEHLFGSVVDEVVRLAPCPSIVFTAKGGQWPPRWIMVPTGGTEPAARAAELAFSLAGPETRVLLFHVVDPDLSMEMTSSRPGAKTVSIEIGQDIVNELKQLGLRMGVRVLTEVVMGGAMVPNVVERASRDIDLIVLGTGVRAGSQRLFLGPKVERLLAEAPCSVIVLNV
jgi:nucleotide-binding universal stress UspA family protein